MSVLSIFFHACCKSSIASMRHIGDNYISFDIKHAHVGAQACIANVHYEGRKLDFCNRQVLCRNLRDGRAREPFACFTVRRFIT